MRQMSERNFPKDEIGDTEKLRDPEVEIGRIDSRNILGGILQVNAGCEMYETGTKQERLSQKY